jgi:hypothetical protein
MGAKPPTLGYAGRQLWVGREESTDTPDSVPAHSCPCVGDGHPSRPAVADWLKRPTRVLRRAAVERTHIRTCSRWGLPSRPGHPGRWWSLTPPFHPDRPRRNAAVGGLLSVALSRGSPRVAVSHHRALRSPDVPRPVTVGDRTRPSGRLFPPEVYCPWLPTRSTTSNRTSPVSMDASTSRART